MFARMLETLFGCWHSHLSFPMTVRPGVRRKVAPYPPTGTYVVCLDCGKEFAYDWREMKVVTPGSRNKARVGDLATKEVA